MCAVRHSRTTICVPLPPPRFRRLLHLSEGGCIVFLSVAPQWGHSRMKQSRAFSSYMSSGWMRYAMLRPTVSPHSQRACIDAPRACIDAP
eukprot:1007076-Pleurochrysis_carterae.AAC.3